jgi:hypothetical protein
VELAQVGCMFRVGAVRGQAETTSRQTAIISEREQLTNYARGRTCVGTAAGAPMARAGLACLGLLSRQRGSSSTSD